MDNGEVSVELRKLIKERDSVIKLIKIEKKYLVKFDPVSCSVNQLQIRSNELCEHMRKFELIQDVIKLHDKLTDAMLSERAVIEDEYYTIKAMLKEFIDKNKTIEDESTQFTNTQTIVRHLMKFLSNI